MNDDHIIENIIDLCLQINQETSFIYTEFGDKCDDPEIKAFWNKMSDETNLRLEYWKELKELNVKATLPVMFKDPLTVIKELKENLLNINEITRTDLSNIENKQKYTLAFRLEFFVLHRAFSTFCNFTKNLISDKKTPDDDYEEHLNSFIETMKIHGRLTPELELVGMTMRRLWEEIRVLSVENTQDSMTGILNKHGFFQIITPMAYLAHRNAANVGFIMLDIDDFKKINDAHGHQAGDRVLESVAAIIKSSVRKHDVVGRFGGDELIVFLPSVDRGLTKIVAERICLNIANRSAESIPVTASIGYAEDTIREDVEEMIQQNIKQADNFLYKAKKAGKNCVAGASNA